MCCIEKINLESGKTSFHNCTVTKTNKDENLWFGRPAAMWQGCSSQKYPNWQSLVAWIGDYDESWFPDHELAHCLTLVSSAIERLNLKWDDNTGGDTLKLQVYCGSVTIPTLVSLLFLF